MTRIISIHSFRGGTGKSNLTANVAATVATRGYRVGIVDTDINSPGIHVLFGLDEDHIEHSLNDYLWGKCDVEDAASDVSAQVGLEPGSLYLIPSSIRAGEIARILREGYDVGLLNEGFNDLGSRLSLDYLFIDTHPGLNEETLLSVAISQMLIIILRPDEQDYQGTSVTVDVARRLEVPRLRLVVNKVLSSFDFDEVKVKIAQTYDCEVAAVLPLSEDVVRLASAGVFCLLNPADHPFCQGIHAIAEEVLTL